MGELGPCWKSVGLLVPRGKMSVWSTYSGGGGITLEPGLSNFGGQKKVVVSMVTPCGVVGFSPEATGLK